LEIWPSCFCTVDELFNLEPSFISPQFQVSSRERLQYTLLDKK
jgi:hypothetical protein